MTKICYCLLSLCISVTAFAQPKVYSIAKIQRPFLYEAKKGSKVIYLFGTIHVEIDSTELPNWFWNYFNRAESYFFEVGMYGGGISNEEQWEKLDNQITKGHIKEMLTAQEYKNLDFYFRDLKDKDKYFREHSVSYIAHLIYDERRKIDKSKKTEVFPQLALDDQLEKAATRNTIKGIHYLDEFKDNSFGCAYQTDDGKNLYNLKYYLNNLPNAKPDKTHLDRMLENYRKGIESKPAPGSEISVFNEDCIVTGRNKIWLPKILAVSKKSNKVFVVAGLAHINEHEPNLIQLLKKEGFKVRRLEK